MKKKFIESITKCEAVGHRGASNELPANSIESFKRAVKIDSNIILEFDVWQSKDKKIIIAHDDELDVVTSSDGLISETKYADLLKLNIGYNFTNDGGKTYPYRKKHFKYPTLEQILEEFPKQRMSIDIKFNDLDFAKKIFKVLKKYKCKDYITIGSFHSKIIKLIRKDYSDFTRSFGKFEIIKFLIFHKLFLAFICPVKDDLMMIPEYTDTENPEYIKNKFQGLRIITKRFLKDAQKKGIPVMVWTVNNPDNMKKLFKLGVDGIISDDPKTLKKIIK